MNTLDQYTRRVLIAASIAALYLAAWWLRDVFILLFGALFLFNPQFLRPLYTTGLGIMMMAGSAVLMILGVLWLRKITEIKV